MIKLSIIIPVYKVEKYIEDCLESICNQMMEDVEVIIINDGTPDKSMEIARSFIENNYKKYTKNFVFLEQENQGQSVARNNGIIISKGNYICFIDSDDYLLQDYFLSIYDAIIKNNTVDIIHFNAKQYLEKEEKYIDDLVLVDCNDVVIKTEQYLRKLFLQSQWYPWLRVIKREIILDYTFEKNLYMEDKILFPELYYDERVIEIAELKKNLICYRHREGSSIRSGYNKKLLDGIDYGIEKFSKNNFCLYTIVYNQFLMQKISILIDLKFSIFYIIRYLEENKDNINLKYDANLKLFLMKNFSLLYIILCWLKKNAGV